MKPALAENDRRKKSGEPTYSRLPPSQSTVLVPPASPPQHKGFCNWPRVQAVYVIGPSLLSPIGEYPWFFAGKLPISAAGTTTPMIEDLGLFVNNKPGTSHSPITKHEKTAFVIL